MVEKLETGTSQVLAELELGVLKVTLNRPEARNALSEELTPALREMVAACSSDDRIRCLLLTGAGKAFCAGGDIKGMGNKGNMSDNRSLDEKIDDLQHRQNTLTLRLYEIPKPTCRGCWVWLLGKTSAAQLLRTGRISCDSRYGPKTNLPIHRYVWCSCTNLGQIALG